MLVGFDRLTVAGGTFDVCAPMQVWFSDLVSTMGVAGLIVDQEKQGRASASCLSSTLQSVRWFGWVKLEVWKCGRLALLGE